ncbi:hypothetical protein [Mycolicibacterium llatzerense]|uniref:Uncharacterized protein n=1 Tax=Mycolicibacterium llatzerense TaxID=280871 RepID=A0A0D1L099_9MYCO|nr:hypothetical protein [Mycolicibacterium llatzerense]KIU14485.1 hypothetical protein TL10_24205 [Mycolicibacterium llatzerense]
MRLSEQQRRHIEDRIRAAADRLLRGDIPPGRHCDVKTLAFEAGVSRAALYGTYRHLKEDFERRRASLTTAGELPDQRLVQIANLKRDVAKLRARIVKQQETITELENFRGAAVSRLAAQHDEIARLTRAINLQNNVRDIASAEHGRR